MCTCDSAHIVPYKTTVIVSNCNTEYCAQLYTIEIERFDKHMEFTKCNKYVQKLHIDVSCDIINVQTCTKVGIMETTLNNPWRIWLITHSTTFVDAHRVL